MARESLARYCALFLRLAPYYVHFIGCRLRFSYLNFASFALNVAKLFTFPSIKTVTYLLRILPTAAGVLNLYVFLLVPTIDSRNQLVAILTGF
jgi:hypothetical protein